jgi:uncharacterized protein (DUF1015 family)
VPTVRPFRALRYGPEAAADLRRVVSPPYDIISPDLQRTLLARDPRNVVRLDLPEVEPGDQPDERYRRAARALAAWRSDGTLHKDPRPSLYVYEMVIPGEDGAAERAQLGFFGRLRLESLDPGSGVRPHERTLAAPREDRYRLLRATGVNTSPVVGLYEDGSGEAAALLEAVTSSRADADVVDDDGVRHRLWDVPDDGDPAGAVAKLTRIAGANPITIADGHHRYETALRYRDERRMTRSCEEDPAFDYLLALLVEWTGQRLTVLPTHRVVRNVEGDVEALAAAAGSLFEVVPADRAALERWDSGQPGGRGRFGLWTRSGGFCLDARRSAFVPWLPPGGEAVRALDVTLLGVALERLLGIDPQAIATGERVAYTKSATEALAWVDGRRDGSDVAFLLEPTPVASIVEVAAQGDVMPQKSTYFHPKPLTGLVINPHEW